MGGLAFAFREGALVKAVREGHWLLLDEINLAPPEVCSALRWVQEAVTIGARNCPLIIGDENSS